MEPTRRDPLDELCDALHAVHEASVGGGPPASAASVFSGDPPLAARYRANLECLRLIDRVRRRHGHVLAGIFDEKPLAIPSAGTSLPETIGRFQILGELGHGGHGVVLLARDPLVGREVALKVPRLASLFAPELRARFLREARAAGKLKHPHIVPVYEVQEDGGVMYIASEYCPGPTLRAWLDAQTEPVSPRLAARLVADLAGAMAYAHAQGVLHRDLKPSNVLLLGSWPPEAVAESVSALPPLVPKLTDFGLAKLADSRDALSRSGVLMGTPAYMAPEQAEGRHSALGPATDVYGLGAVLYEVLVGRPPFEGASDADTLRRIIADEPDAVRRCRPAISRDLEAIVLKCLAKEPLRRYATMDELRADLERHLAGRATLARPPGVRARAVRTLRRHKAAAGVVLVVAAGLAALVAGVRGHWRTLSAAREQTQQVRALAKDNDALREHLYATELKGAFEAHRQGDVSRAIEILEQLRSGPSQHDTRGFLWHHLWWRCHGTSEPLLGHTGPVYHLASTADGSRLASAGADGTIRLWDLQRKQACGIIRTGDREISNVAFSPDSRLLASAGSSGRVRLWDLATLRQTAVLGASSDGFANIAFSPDGRALATAGHGTLIALWDCTTREQFASLAGHDDAVTCLAFSPDGKWLGSSSADQTARLWNWANQTAHCVLAGHASKVKSISFSPDSSLVVTAGVDSTVRIWNASDGSGLARLEGHRRRVSAALFYGDDANLVSAGEDGTIRGWDTLSARSRWCVNARQGRIWSLAVCGRSRLLATGGTDGSVRMWPRAAARDTAAWPPETVHHRPFAFTPEGRLLTTSERPGHLALCDLERSRTTPIAPESVDEGATWAVYASNGALAASNHGDIYRLSGNPAKPNPLAVVRRHPIQVNCLALRPDGSLLATGTNAPDASIRIWDASTGERVKELSLGRAINAVEFTADGRHLIVAAAQNAIHVYAVPELELRHELRGHTSDVGGLAISPDGAVLASYGCGADRTVRQWSTATWKPRSLAVDHPATVNTVAFCPNEPFLATGCDDGCVRLWHDATGELVAVLTGHEGPLAQVAFDPRGRWLASYSWPGGKSLLWPAPSAAD